MGSARLAAPAVFVLLTLGAAGASAAGALAAGAACGTTPKGEVARMVCEDAALAALDRRLGEALAAASARARGPLATRLRQDQRDWMRTRDGCAKTTGRTWVTANWAVDTVKGCIDAQYRLRTSELQATWRLVPGRTASYVCGRAAADDLVADFFATDPPTIRLERGDRVAMTWRVDAAGEGVYEGRNISVVHAGNTLKLAWLDTSTGRIDEPSCRER